MKLVFKKYSCPNNDIYSLQNTHTHTHTHTTLPLPSLRQQAIIFLFCHFSLLNLAGSSVFLKQWHLCNRWTSHLAEPPPQGCVCRFFVVRAVLRVWAAVSQRRRHGASYGDNWWHGHKVCRLDSNTDISAILWWFQTYSDYIKVYLGF